MSRKSRTSRKTVSRKKYHISQGASRKKRQQKHREQMAPSLQFKKLLKMMAFLETYIEEDSESCPQWLKNVPELLEIERGFPKAHFDARGRLIFIQLREVRDEQILVVGCGNNPTCKCMNCPPDLSVKARDMCDECYEDTWFSNAIWEQRLSGPCHCHVGTITVDPCLMMNPTFVGLFGHFELPVKDRFLYQIELEGIILDNRPLFHTEVGRLLVSGNPGNVSHYCNGETSIVYE